MLRDIYPVQWTDRQAVVTLPEHIDVSNAGQIREELLSVINRGAKALIADMTATISCDHAGADAVVRAHQRAVTSGAELRLVVTAQIVSRVLSLSGLDQLVSIYPSLEAATAARAPAAVLPLAARTAETGATDPVPGGGQPQPREDRARPLRAHRGPGRPRGPAVRRPRRAGQARRPGRAGPPRPGTARHDHHEPLPRRAQPASSHGAARRRCQAAHHRSPRAPRRHDPRDPQHRIYRAQPRHCISTRPAQRRQVTPPRA